jgi:hypothetical protein
MEKKNNNPRVCGAGAGCLLHMMNCAASDQASAPGQRLVRANVPDYWRVIEDESRILPV